MGIMIISRDQLTGIVAVLSRGQFMYGGSSPTGLTYSYTFNYSLPLKLEVYAH